MTREELKSMFGGIVKHYNHAGEKHPLFADEMCTDTDWQGDADFCKRLIKGKVVLKEKVTAHAVLHAELCEIFAAFCSGNYEQARYEVLDAIAVLLRMDDMIRDAQERKEKKNDV